MTRSRITMRDVARAAGVSPMTVSRALREDGFVNSVTRKAVQDAADRLGYVYDTTATAFRAQRSGFLAVTMPSINNANFAATHRGLLRGLAGTDLQVLLGITDYKLCEEERLVRQLLARRPEAIVLTGGVHTEATRALVTALAVPVVEIWDLPQRPIGHMVGFSNADAMRPVVEHLAATGRRRLAFLGAADEGDRRGADRREGVIRTARDLGLPEVELLDAGPAPVSMTEGARVVREAGARLSGFDAVVCVSDPVAFGALSACQAMGLAVPGDIAITGFGAFEIAAVSTPPITTLDVQAERIGIEAGKIVAAILSEPDRKFAAKKVETDVRLLVGGST